MGFDQYHEPAEELSAETRTFARMLASLTRSAGTSSGSRWSRTSRLARSCRNAQLEAEQELDLE